jgi:hypothetical protein
MKRPAQPRALIRLAMSLLRPLLYRRQTHDLTRMLANESDRRVHSDIVGDTSSSREESGQFRLLS